MSDKPRVGASSVLLFLATALAVVAALAAYVEWTGAPRWWLRFGVVSPAIVALIFVAVEGRSARVALVGQLAMAPSRLAWIAASVVTFGALAFAAAAVSSELFGTTAPHLHWRIGWQSLLLIFALSVGEELGWRGYALPRLSAAFGWPIASLLLGVVWWLWHLPGWMLGFGAPTDISIFIFGAWVVAASFLFSWFFVRSGRSTWTAIMLHTGANVSFGLIPVMRSAANGPETFYLLTGLTVILAMIAAFDLRRAT